MIWYLLTAASDRLGDGKPVRKEETFEQKETKGSGSEFRSSAGPQDEVSASRCHGASTVEPKKALRRQMSAGIFNKEYAKSSFTYSSL